MAQQVYKRKNNQKIKFIYSEPVQEVLFYLRENQFITLDQAREVSRLPKFKAEHLLSDLILLGVIELELSESSEVYKLSPADSDSKVNEG